MGADGWFAWTLLVVGGLAWGVYGITGFFGETFLLVDWIFRWKWLINTVYSLVGLSAVYALFATPIKLILGRN